MDRLPFDLSLEIDENWREQEQHLWQLVYYYN